MADCARHFKCVSKDDYKGLTSTVASAILAGALTIVEIVAAIVLGSPIPGLGIVAGAVFVVAVFELCAFLHGGKLICIEHDACAIGRIMNFIPVGADKVGFEKMDDDYTFNILPSPHAPVETLEEMLMSDPYQAKFMNRQPPSDDLGLGFAGVSVTFTGLLVEGVPRRHETEVLHCEIKGCRVHDVCNVLKALSFGAPVVGIICTIPLVGSLACLVAAVIWLGITSAAVAIAWNATHNGDINDVYDPAAGRLTEADPETGEGGDVVLVAGDWIYDAGHSGWNEIHPIRHVQRLTADVDARYRGMQKASPQLVEEFKREVLDVWCFHVGQARDPIVIEAQGRPENSWHIHPSIDGCERPIIIE